MKKNTILILISVIVVLIIISIVISSNSTSSRSEAQSAGQKLLPKLYDRLNDVTKIEINKSTGTVVIEKLESAWVVKSKDNYPANVTQVRNTLVALAELEKVESKTKKEKNYSKLGVQSLATNKTITGQTAYINISAQSEKLASVIIGNQKSGHPPTRALGIKNLNYVRLATDVQVWLAAGNLNLPALKNYMNTELTKIPVARIQQVTITQPKGATIKISKASKTDKEFTLKQLRKSKELSAPGILNSIASSLSNLNFEDVMLKNNDTKFNKPIKTQFKAFNGLTIDLNLVKADSKYYLWFAAKTTDAVAISLEKEDIESKADAPDAKQEASDINKNFSRWLFTIPSYQGESLTKQLKDLLKPKAIK